MLKRLAEKAADGFATFVAVVEHPVVHIYADKFIGDGRPLQGTGGGNPNLASATGNKPMKPY